VTQTNEILSHLESGKSISTIEAFEIYKITRLSEYIRHLRNDLGYQVLDKWETPPSGKKYKRYWLSADKGFDSRVVHAQKSPVPLAPQELFHITQTQHGVMM